MNLEKLFDNNKLFKLSLTHRSCGNKNNERLEFLGDSVLSFVISDYLYNQYDKYKEGELTRLRSSLVCGNTLTKIAKDLKLSDKLLLGTGETRTGGHQRDSILENTLEAIIGALFLDQGIEKTKDFIFKIYDKYLKNIPKDAHLQKDPKTDLQEYLQSRGLNTPIYELTETSGEPHNRKFTVECRVVLSTIESKENIVTAVGTSRRKAEQEAAKKILKVIKNDK